MFGYCLWYELRKHHEYYTIINNFSKNFSTCVYNPHLTIKSNMNLSDSMKLYNIYKQKIMPNFKILGDIYQTEFKHFYALQQDFIDINDNTIYHVSLAYKLDKSFTNEELNYVKSLNKLKISADDLQLTIFNCNSRFANKWKKIL